MNNIKHLSFSLSGKIVNQKYEIDKHMKIMTQGIDEAAPTQETAGWRESKEKRQNKKYDGKALLKEKEKQKNNNILAENLYNIKNEDRRLSKVYHPGWRMGKNGVVIDCYPKKDREFLFHQLHSKKFLRDIEKLKEKNVIHNNIISKENPRMHSLYAVDKLKKGYEHNRYFANILFSKPSPTILHLGLKQNVKNPSPYDKTRESVAPFRNRKQTPDKRPASASCNMRSGTNNLTFQQSTTSPFLKVPKKRREKIELNEWDDSPMKPFPKVVYYGNDPREKDYALWLLSTSMSKININNTQINNTSIKNPIFTPEKQLKQDKKVKNNSVIQEEKSPNPNTQINQPKLPQQQQPQMQQQKNHSTELKVNKKNISNNNNNNNNNNNEFKSPLSLKFRPFSANANIKETSNKDVLRNRILYGRSAQSNEFDEVDAGQNNNMNCISKDENNNIKSNDDIEFENHFFNHNKSPDRFYILNTDSIDDDNSNENNINTEFCVDDLVNNRYEEFNNMNDHDDNNNNNVIIDNDIEKDDIINILDQVPFNDDELLLSTSQSVRSLEAFIQENLLLNI